MTTTPFDLDAALVQLRDFAERPDAPEDLSASERLEMATRTRDVFFAAEDTMSPRDVLAVRDVMEKLERQVPVDLMDGMAISWHPTARFSALRFVDAAELPHGLDAYFTRPSVELPELAAVFVDPQEFHFRTFEHILPLDRYFERHPLALTLETEDGHLHDEGRELFTFRVRGEDASLDALRRLDELGLYVAPLNEHSRGGQRAIFHSEVLSGVLTEAVRCAMPADFMQGFSHVNPVFRCNRFEPGDEPFHPHFDTPYYDRARDHISRYTMIVYVTGGEASPALSVADIDLDSIDEMTCVVFDQRHLHAGQAYHEGRKVFLRTELVFEDADVEHEPSIAHLFSKACYFTGESLFTPEVAEYTHACYDRVAAAHWLGLEDDDDEVEPFVHKTWRGVHFVTNGHDFWFDAEVMTLEESAVVAVLDYFNCMVDHVAFRKQCTTDLIEDRRDAAWVPAFLHDQRDATRPGARAPVIPVLHKQGFFHPCDQVDSGNCCPFHRWESFDPRTNDDVQGHFEATRAFSEGLMNPAPVLMMGEEVLMDPSRITIHGDKIYVSSDAEPAPVNFAACWNYGAPGNFIEVDAVLEAEHLLIPPIPFAQSSGCIHLMLDFFRNDWMVRRSRHTVHIPKIMNLTPESELDEMVHPWVNAASDELERAGEEPEDWQWM